MTLRSIATPLTIGSFVVVTFSGLCLLFHVRGLVNPIHQWSSILFVIGSILHGAINWRPTLNHLSKPAVAGFTLLCCLVAGVGLLPAGDRGGNPHRVAGQTMGVLLELDLHTLAGITHQTEEDLKAKLRAQGFTFGENATVRQIAQASHRDPILVLDLVFPHNG